MTPESNGTVRHGVVRAQARGARPRAPSATRSTIAATTGSTSSSVRVRSGARNSSANARLLRPSGTTPARKTSNSDDPVEELPAGVLQAACTSPGRHVVRHHEREVSAERREPRDVAESERAGWPRPRSRSARARRRRRALRGSSDRRARGWSSPITPTDRSVEHDARRSTRVERRARRLAERPSVRSTPSSSKSDLDDATSHPARPTPGPRRPALPRRAAQDEIATCRRSLERVAEAEHVPTSKIETDPDPPRWFRAAVRSRPGSDAVRRHAFLARRGFATADRVGVAHQRELGLGRERQRRGLAESGTDEQLPDAARER